MARARPSRISSSSLADGATVVYIDCGTFDRCAVYGGEPENHVSWRALEAAGFHVRSSEPGCEEMLYYELWAPGRPAG